jgi:hypothetical protein
MLTGDEIGWACGTDEGEDKFIKGLGWREMSD